MLAAEFALPPAEKPAAPLQPEIAGSSVVAPQSEALAAALDCAFAEPTSPPFRRTWAIVVVKDGRVIAERYADGIGIAHGCPSCAFFAKGSIGQYVIVIPSERLVIARFGRIVNWPLDADGASQLVADVVAATHDKAKLAGRN